MIKKTITKQLFLLVRTLVTTTVMWTDIALADPGAQTVKAPTNLVTLGRIDGEQDQDLTTINIRLNQDPTWKKLGPVQDHGSFLQLILPGTLVPEPGKFFEGGNSLVPKIAAFQLTPSDAGIRLFVDKDATTVKQALEAETLGNRVVLTIDHSKLPPSFLQASAPVEVVGPPPPKELTADEVIAKTEVTHDEPAPSERMKAELRDKADSISGAAFDFRSKLMQVSAFSAVMLVLLILVKMVKPYTKRGAKGLVDFAADAPITIKTLASLNLAPRQKVSLLQVGGEKILIGITPEHVSFLTTIGAAQGGIAAGANTIVARNLPPALISDKSTDFASALAEAPDTLSLQRAPAPAAPSTPAKRRVNPTTVANTQRPTTPVKAARPAAPEQSPKPASGSRINISVGEDGVKNLDSTKQAIAKNAAPNDKPATQEAIDDVTKMIREKLKTLRSI